MNPFEGKSLTELLDGVPGYTDPELDALCACVCDGEWAWLCDGSDWLFWGYEGGKPVSGTIQRCHSYTTDPREAMRLLVKYRLNASWTYDLKDSRKEFLCIQKALGSDIPIVDYRVQKDLDPLHLICRAITEAAATAALTELIHAKSNNK